jgi:AcrR family transcriptional regulator
VPRGVAIPDPREALFQATDGLLSREGPEGLTSRSVTDEAGCAKGVLHNHFGDFDQFLLEYTLDRISRTAQLAWKLPERCGKASVAANLTAAVMDLFGPNILGLSNLLASRSSLLAKLQESGQATTSAFAGIERAFSAYLEAEKGLGRMSPDADTEMMAFTLLGAVHHAFFTTGLKPLRRNRVQRIVGSIVGGLSLGPSQPLNP